MKKATFPKLLSLEIFRRTGLLDYSFPFICVLFLVLIVTPELGHSSDNLFVANFEKGRMDFWKEKSFHQRTFYSCESVDGKIALKAQAHASASVLYRKIDINLLETPFLNWSWRPENLLPGLDERSRGGDDYSVRIYVVFKGKYFFSRPRSLNYVWSSNQPKGAIWPSAFTDRSIMVALRSKKDKTGQWYHEKRNIREDIMKMFGVEINEIGMVAVMTDTDQSGLKAIGWYGDIFFSSN